MSISNDISILLNMKDEFVKFYENSVKEVHIKGKRSFVISGYLDRPVNICKKCNSTKLKKNGTRTSLITIPKISEINSYLSLKKQIYKCLVCGHKHTSTTNIVDYGCHISNNTKHAVIHHAKEITTNKRIATNQNISPDSVQRFLDTIYSVEKLYKHHLPSAICFDEFTYQKGKMAFNMCNAETGKTIDIVCDRSLDNLLKYFHYYTLESRIKVKYIVIDMYKPYISLINNMFPNAKIIIDKFHLVQLISRAFNKTRIDIMNKDKENYRKYKRYWKLFLTSRLELKCNIWKKYLCFKNLMTEVDIVDYLLNTTETLKESYNLYQNILYAIQRNDYKLLVKILEEDYDLVSNKMKTVLNTVKEYLPYIKNTLENNYSNGVMERNNNTCKLLKRIAFGFRNFRNFKAKILISTSLFRKSKKSTEFSLSTPQSC